MKAIPRGRRTRGEGWGVFEIEDGCRHIAPIKDGRAHVMSMGCWCLPAMDPDDRDIIVHRAEDGRS